MAYTASPQTVTRDAVRVLVGDVSTSTSATYLDDAEYNYFISATPNTYIAAQLAANSLAALFAGAAASAVGGGWVERTVGDLKIKKSDASQAAAGYQALAQKFGRMAAAQITPYAGGIAASDKDDVESNTDRVRPAFLRGLFDNPQAINATRATAST